MPRPENVDGTLTRDTRSASRRLFAVAVATVLAFVALFAQPTGADLVIVIDSDSPVGDADAADRLVSAAVGGFDRERSTISFQLTARGASRIPNDDEHIVPLVHFDNRRLASERATMSLFEASEILRKNEAMRDTVIRRECGEQASAECTGAVHARAIALAEDSDAAAVQKVRSLAEIARTTRAPTIVLATAGWPTRNSRPELDTALGELRAAGSRLVVWRLPSTIAYKGLIRDSADAFASRARATVMPLRNDGDPARVRAASEPKRAAAAASAAPSAKATRGGATGASDATLRRASAYVAKFEETFASVMWSERYEQERRMRMKFGASGTRFSTLLEQRALDSDLLLLWLPRDASWMAVRDVIAVDGVARTDEDRRVRAELAGASVSVDRLRELADQNGRHNIGQIIRTFNEPTLALLFLDEHYRSRFTFQRGKDETIDRRRGVTYVFTERSKPTVVRDRDRDVAASGTLWIDDSTGQVLQTLLELADSAGGLQGRMTVRYGAHPKFDVLVPLEMRETYTAASGEEISTVAAYSNFRRFETAGRLIIPK
jgi:hypothetical protein